MSKILLLIASIILFSQTALADTCPSVTDIKQNHLDGWKAFDSEDGTPFPPGKIAQLAKYIHQFALAEYTAKGPNGTAVHCYYRDVHGSDLEAYFSKDNINPINAKNTWYQVSGYMHCAAGNENCAFQSKLPLGSGNTLAKK